MAASSIETEITTALAKGDRAAAANSVLRARGAEVFGFLVTVLEHPAAVAAYRAMAEMIPLEIDGAAEGSMSTWLYRIAQRAALRQAEAGLGAPPPFDPTLPDPRTTQRRYSVRLRRAAVRLRRELSVAERILIVLRVGRGLSWQEIAEVDLGTRAPAAARAARARLFARQFEALRAALRREAIERGIFGK